MHKLIDYVCDELEEIERKAEKDGKLSLAEVQYADTLAHLKKNLLKAEEMGDEYSHGRSYRGMSYARRGNVRRDAMGRYSRSGGEFAADLRDLAEIAPDEHTRQKLHEMAAKMDGIM